MNKVVIALVVVVGLVVFLRFRAGMVAERKLVMERLNEEQRQRGSAMPTELVFREAGKRMPGPSVEPAPSERPAPSSTTAPTAPPTGDGDVSVLFAGISMPAGLIPLVDDSFTPASASFVTDEPASVVVPAISAELDRLGLETVWETPELARVRRETAGAAATGTVSVHPEAYKERTDDDRPAFPTVTMGRCAVRLVAE